ncbi:element excision factor XisI family protein [Microcoleus sp. A006_D1]|uniref:element excision factor XisI family protein n=1 Tax=Microcoleus sp. A006_D1 TaxID=3055267 RepID=UPI002FD36F86
MTFTIIIDCNDLKSHSHHHRRTRVFGCLIYIEIKDGKIWIERDRTEIGVANELVEAGVPRQILFWHFTLPTDGHIPSLRLAKGVYGR